MQDKRQKVFHYKAVKFQKDGTQSIANHLKNAFSQKPRAVDRMEQITENGEQHIRLINGLQSIHNLVCGTMMSYTKGVFQNVVRLDAEATTLDLRQIPPRLEQPEDQAEFVQGLFHFGALQNHLIYVGSLRLHSQAFENHLLWLLSEHTKLLPDGEKLYLADPIKPSMSGKNYKGLKQLRIATKLEFREREEKESTTSKTESVKTVVEPRGPAWRAVAEFLEGLGTPAPDINIKNGLPPENLELEMKITAKYLRRENAALSTPVLDPLANAFRHIDDVPIEFTFRDGTRIKGSDFKISQKMSVDCNNGVEDPESVYKCMAEWLNILLSKGEITS